MDKSAIYSGKDIFGKPNKVLTNKFVIDVGFHVTVGDIAPIVEDFIHQYDAELSEQEKHPLFYWSQFTALPDKGTIAIEVTLFQSLTDKPVRYFPRPRTLLGRIIVRPRKVEIQHYPCSDQRRFVLGLVGAPLDELLGKVPWKMGLMSDDLPPPDMPKEVSDAIYSELNGDKFFYRLIDYIRKEVGSVPPAPQETPNKNIPKRIWHLFTGKMTPPQWSLLLLAILDVAIRIVGGIATEPMKLLLQPYLDLSFSPFILLGLVVVFIFLRVRQARP